MAYAIRPAGAHLDVDLTGLPGKADFETLFGEIRRQGGAVMRVLIEFRTETCLDTLDTLDVVSGLPRDCRIALLITDERMRDSAQFAETVAVNRGIAVRMFDRRSSAEHWLDA